MYIMCPIGYYQSAKCLMVTHVIWHVMYGYTLLALMNQRMLSKSSKDHKKSCEKWLMTYECLNTTEIKWT